MSSTSWLPSRSINKRLAVLTVGSVGLALLVCCVAFVVNDTIMLRDSMARQSLALAEVLASNSTAALSFRQPDIATELLQSMPNRPEIHSA